MLLNLNKYFIFSASCKAVDGVSRSLIIDYLRNELFFISNEYYQLLQELDRKKIEEVLEYIDEESKEFFLEFINFLITNELGFLVDNLENFPKISTKIVESFPVKDAIIEIDESIFDEFLFTKFCSDLQIRVLSNSNYDFVEKILKITHNFNFNYLELHLAFYNSAIDTSYLFKFIENFTFLSNIFIYDSPKLSIENLIIQSDKNYSPMEFGKVYYLDYSFNGGSCCGIINKENLSIQSVTQHNELTKFNGCLYKKVTIDRNGNIKNCPSINKTYGNIKYDSIKQIIEKEDFEKLGLINKDQIEVCNTCEFRYN